MAASPPVGSAFAPSLPVRMPIPSKTQTSLLSAEEDTEAVADVLESSPEVTTPPKPAVKCPDCDLCDGSGRITGGIGAVLDWWPIKAYRPCPNFIDRGGRYVRSGQALDEIAFGRDSTFDPKDL
eukprot:CAMPEP_0183295330 /NCGR_PEP_ID=MMETSP0160_2-20130417/3330_1 /TAXON_ID=2839 ORGANISM="Odontella Sinensis, Strain Grunow 1884" /NCGR_SAMPLE_ID=MMETSP0160_2 /ASSEMBLY_ACC=CAM_ASM_000250 /LENGTH=123 /DNA_ID=CAMNT_0025456799 /DNA_START=73 /DNA_END=444 /DNA_ORIENTATION=+